MELVGPDPALPAASLTPALLNVIKLFATVMLAVGVKVAVNVVPPSEEDAEVSEPFAIVRSALLKPVTASENVNVTKLDSPNVK